MPDENHRAVASSGRVLVSCYEVTQVGGRVQTRIGFLFSLSSECVFVLSLYYCGKVHTTKTARSLPHAKSNLSESKHGQNQRVASRKSQRKFGKFRLATAAQKIRGSRSGKDFPGLWGNSTMYATPTKTKKPPPRRKRWEKHRGRCTSKRGVRGFTIIDRILPARCVPVFCRRCVRWTGRCRLHCPCRIAGEIC